MMSLFRIKYIDVNNEVRVMAVVAETMSAAVKCFEETIDIDPTECSVISEYDGMVLVDE